MTKSQTPNNTQYPIINNQTRRFGYWNLVIGVCLVIGVWLLVISPSCYAVKDIVFEAAVDRDVAALGESMQLSLTFQGATDVPAPQITEPEGFSAKYLGPSTMMSIVNGRMSSSISHTYILIPLKSGKFTLGPFSAEYQGQKYMSQAVEVEVVDQPTEQASQQRRQLLSGGGEEDITAERQLKDRIFVELDAGKRDMYLNEIMPITVRLYVNRLALKNIGYPIIAADGFLKEEFKDYKEYQKTLAALVYNVIEFKTQAYPLKTGALTLGPAEIKCNLVVQRQPQRRRPGFPFDDFSQDDDFFSDFFSRYETYPLDLKSTELSINVKPLPQENKPADFTGAVNGILFTGAIGEFDLEASAGPLNVKVGDPISLKITISGSGNFATVNAPVLEDTKDFKVYPPQAKSENNQKIFEQVVMPLSENVTRISVISFSFFNPKIQAYQTVKRGPFAITVSKPEAGSEQMARPKLIEALPAQAGAPRIAIPEKEEVLGRDIVYIKDNPGIIIRRGRFLYRNKSFVWIFILPLALFLVLFMIENRNQRMRTDTRFARMQKAYKNARKKLDAAKGFLDKDKKEEFYSAAFKALQDYIGDRLHIPSGGITAVSAEQILRPKGAPEDILNKIKEVFDACDAARFAATAVTKDDMVRVFQLAKEIIEGLERVRL